MTFVSNVQASVVVKGGGHTVDKHLFFEYGGFAMDAGGDLLGLFLGSTLSPHGLFFSAWLTVPLWQESDRTRTRTPALNLQSAALSSSSGTCPS